MSPAHNQGLIVYRFELNFQYFQCVDGIKNVESKSIQQIASPHCAETCLSTTGSRGATVQKCLHCCATTSGGGRMVVSIGV
jgi:hypothetical protein